MLIDHNNHDLTLTAIELPTYDDNDGLQRSVLLPYMMTATNNLKVVTSFLHKNFEKFMYSDT